MEIDYCFFAAKHLPQGHVKLQGVASSLEEVMTLLDVFRKGHETSKIDVIIGFYNTDLLGDDGSR